MAENLFRSSESLIRPLFLWGVILLLQSALILPSLVHPLTPKVVNVVCEGDHEKCGCSPARVAAKTCCCFISTLPPCCKKKALDKLKNQKTLIAQAPCGNQEVFPLTELAPFMPKVFNPPGQYSVAWAYPSYLTDSFYERFLEPAVPPPQRDILI